MEKPGYVLNDIKYQRALNEAKDRNNEAEVKALYVSYGGAVPLNELSTKEIKMEEEKIETTEVAEEVAPELEEESTEEVVIESEEVADEEVPTEE